MTRRSRPGRPAPRAKLARGKRLHPRLPSGLPPARPSPEDRPAPSNEAGDSDEESSRLQKYMAAAGVGSRRHCEELIQSGRVEIEGEVVTRLGTRVAPGQKVYVDGTLLKVGRKVYYLVNKPMGVVTTNHDPSGRQRVIDLLPSTEERLFAVGRLDRASEGLILVTNDGELAQRLTHPRYGIQKTYRVQVAGVLDRESAAKLMRGVHLAEGLARADAVLVKSSQKNSTWLEMILSEGRNREVRRLLAKVGHKVLSLRRIAVGPLKLGDLGPGEFRQLTPPEVKQLWHEALTARKKRKKHPAALAATKSLAAAQGSAEAAARPGKPTKPVTKRGPERDEDFEDEDLDVAEGTDEELISPTSGPLGGRSAAEDVLIADDVEIGGRLITGGGPAPTILGDDEDLVEGEASDEIPFVDSPDEEGDDEDEFEFELDDGSGETELVEEKRGRRAAFARGPKGRRGGKPGQRPFRAPEGESRPFTGDKPSGPRDAGERGPRKGARKGGPRKGGFGKSGPGKSGPAKAGSPQGASQGGPAKGKVGGKPKRKKSGPGGRPGAFGQKQGGKPGGSGGGRPGKRRVKTRRGKGRT